MITFNFPNNSTADRFIVPIDGVTLISNAYLINTQRPILLDMYYTFYGLLNYDKICSEMLLSDIAEMECSPLDFNTAESLKSSLHKLTPGQEMYLSEIFGSYRSCMQHRNEQDFAYIVRRKFGLSHNPVSSAEIFEEGKAILRQETRSGFEKPTTIDSVIYLDCKNGDGRVPDFKIETEKPKGELRELLDFIEPLFGRIPSQGAIDALGQLYSRIWCRQLNSKTLVLIDNMDVGLSCIETFDFEDILVKIQRVTGAKFVVTGHSCINLNNGWLIKDFSEDYPFCATLKK